MRETVELDQTLLAIHGWEYQCHDFARSSAGKFRSPETVECNNLFLAAKAFDEAIDSQQLGKAAFDFACLCMTKVKNELERTANRLFDGKGLQSSRKYKYQEQLDALSFLTKEGTITAVRSTLVALAKMSEARLCRHELFMEMLHALDEHQSGDHQSVDSAAIRVRERSKRGGRNLGRYVISRTLLMRGLEFDHVYILDANAMDRKNLYVALTRGSRSLTILASSAILDPQ